MVGKITIKRNVDKQEVARAPSAYSVFRSSSPSDRSLSVESMLTQTTHIACVRSHCSNRH